MGTFPAAASQRAGDPQRRKLVFSADDGSEPDPKKTNESAHVMILQIQARVRQ